MLRITGWESRHTWFLASWIVTTLFCLALLGPSVTRSQIDDLYLWLTPTDELTFHITIPDPYRQRKADELLLFDVSGHGEIIIGGRKVRFEGGKLVAVEGLTKWPKANIRISN